MKTRIITYTEDHVPRVKAMNLRLAEGGSNWGFYDMVRPAWLPLETPNQSVHRIFHLVEGEDGEIHGGYCFKEQDFLVHGTRHRLATWQGPVSEGLIDKRFARIGLLCLMDMRDRNPLLFGWGGSDQLNALLESFGGQRFGTPLMLKILKPSRVLAEAPFVRTSKRAELIARIASTTGLATPAVAAVQWASALRAGSAKAAEGRFVERFGPWSDWIWEAAQAQTGWTAVRDADSLDRLMGRPGWPDTRILQVLVGGHVKGWATLRLNPMQDDARFGSLTVGCIVDALALPGHEATTIATATNQLAKEGADLVAGNWTHSIWIAAHAKAGYLTIPNRRPMWVSQDLADLLGEPLSETLMPHLHMTPIDGDGPLGF